jgi:hypothetical protein
MQLHRILVFATNRESLHMAVASSHFSNTRLVIPGPWVFGVQILIRKSSLHLPTEAVASLF